MDGGKYVGNLEGYNPETMSVCLANAKDSEGKDRPSIFLNGNVV